jgi:hypothetical protein
MSNMRPSCQPTTFFVKNFFIVGTVLLPNSPESCAVAGTSATPQLSGDPVIR